MKQTILLAAAMLMMDLAGAQSSLRTTPQLSPLTAQYLDAAKQNRSASVLADYVCKRRTDNTICLSALIKVANGFSEETLKAADVSVGTKAGNIWTVLIPVAKMEAFTTVKGIEYIELDHPVAPMLDAARQKTRVDSVHQGINLPMPYSGKNVIVGIIDFGFDYKHPTLYDTTGTAYRVKKVWELNSTGTPPAGYAYGKEIADTNAIRAAGTDNSVQTHGTAVAGLAAGSGFGSPTQGRFRGMAYNAEMVLVGVRRDSIETQWRTGGFSDFIDGINYIFTFAASVGKPAVVNISWGSQSGPHDGSTLFNQACDNLSGAGKIIVMSAGNEGKENIHLAKTFTATDTMVNTFLDFSSNGYKRTWVDAWGEAGKTFCGKVTMYNGTTPGASVRLCITGTAGSFYLLGSNNLDTCFVKYYVSAASSNNKPRMTIDIYNKSADEVNVAFTGTSGSLNIWNEYYYYGYKYKYNSSFFNNGVSTATTGDKASTVSDMGSAQSVLLVGAYVSKAAWTSINNVGYTAGGAVTNALAYFSSVGPMIDGRVKPDITAPGLSIATAVSSYDTSYTETGANNPSTISTYQMGGKKYYFAEFSGTSASSPVAAGIVALMLQVKPSLTPAEAAAVIKQTAIVDFNTGTLASGPSNFWGYGKINAYAAVKRTIQLLGVADVINQLDCRLYPNPNEGSFVLSYDGVAADDLTVNVLSLNGQIAQSAIWKVQKGNNTKQFDVAAYAKGVYFVQIAGKQGRSVIKMTIR